MVSKLTRNILIGVGVLAGASLLIPRGEARTGGGGGGFFSFSIPQLRGSAGGLDDNPLTTSTITTTTTSPTEDFIPQSQTSIRSSDGVFDIEEALIAGEGFVGGIEAHTTPSGFAPPPANIIKKELTTKLIKIPATRL